MQQAACSRIVTLCRYSLLCHALSPNCSFGLLGLLHPHNYKTRNKRQTNLQKKKEPGFFSLWSDNNSSLSNCWFTLFFQIATVDYFGLMKNVK